MHVIVESLRVSAFTPLQLDYRQMPVDQWWRSVADAEPENVAKNIANMHAVAEGPYSAGRLSVTVGVARVDWTLSPLPSSSPSHWPSVGDWPQGLHGFVSLLSNWFPHFVTPMNRLALGVAALCPVSDSDSGYRVLESALADIVHPKLPTDLSDFLLQFNRPVPSQHGPKGMVINRLGRWGAVRLAPVYVLVGTPPPAGATKTATSPGSFAVRVELDFNTAFESSQDISIEHAKKLLDEMSQLAVSYVEERLK